MPILLDSNILVYNADPSSPFHRGSQDATRWLLARGELLYIVPQNLYEFWVVVTRPLGARGLGMTIAQAQPELARLKSLFRFLPDTPAVYLEWERLIVLHAVSGKNAHDARIVAAMGVHSIKQLLTFNGTDFKRFAGITVIDPTSVTPLPPSPSP